MSKNMKRAGVALVSSAALVASAFVGAPALAAGQSDTSFVSLTPDSGLSYNVLAVAGRTFTLDANQASSITASGRNLKYLVSDPNEAVRPATGTTAAAAVAVEDWSAVASTDLVTVKDTGHGLVAGNFVYVTGLTPQAQGGTTDGTVRAAAWGEIASKTDNTFTFKDLAGVAADIDLADGGGVNSHGKDGAGTYSSVSRATDKSFVVDSDLATNTSDKVLVLENIASTATVSVDVTAWVDDNGNGKIDTTEYASPNRTVAWVGASTVVPTVTWTPVVIGDETMTATVTLSPTINFDQEPKASFEVEMGRQGSNASIASTASTAPVIETWDGVTDQDWTIVGTLAEVIGDLATPKWATLAKKPALAAFDKEATTPTIADITHYAQALTVVTLTTETAHGLSVNDTVTVITDLISATATKITAVTDLTFSYTTTDPSATVEKTVITAINPTVTPVKFAFATAGEYKAIVKLGGTPAKIGATSVIAAGTQVSAGVKNVATVTPDVSSGFSVRAGTVAAVQVTSSVTTSTGLSVGAGIPVSIAVTETSTGIVTVNGTTVTTSKTINTTTDANGQVVISVTNSSGLATQTVALAVSSQGFSDTDTLTWAAAAYALTDSNDNDATGVDERNTTTGGSVVFNLRLADQWGAAPAGEFRVKSVGTGGRYVFTEYAAMSNGSLNLTLTDNPVDATDSTGIVTFATQQKNAAGSWVTPDGTAPLVALKANGAGELDGDAININVRGTSGTTVSLNADAVSAADLSAASTVTALVAADTRDAGVSANDVSLETGDVTATITGTIKDKFTGVAQKGSVVTISGNQAILFSNGVEESFGSFSMIASATGTFSVNAFSNSGLTDSVVTVTSNGASSTVKVSFTGSGSGSGNTFTITAPASAMPGTTFQVKGKLADSYGNGVTVAAPDIKVTYTGPGLVVGTLPTATDAFGEFVFSVLLGSNDSGSAVITASYDQGSDDDFTGTAAGDLDIVVSKTVVIGVSSDTKVNVGTFSGKLVVYALNAAGSEVSYRIAGKWVTQVVTSDPLQRYDRVVGATGKTIKVDIYVDGVLKLAKSVVTK
jgi:hypothetical protein